MRSSESFESSKSNWVPSWVQAGGNQDPVLSPSSNPARTSFSKRVLSDKSFDLVTPDGIVTAFTRTSRKTLDCTVLIEHISKQFLGWQEPKECLAFNFKSTLAQLCLDAVMTSLTLDPDNMSASLTVTITALTTLGILTLDYVEVGTSVGKLFTVAPHRKVRQIAYITRLLGLTDRFDRPLLVYGQNDCDWDLKEIDGRVVAFVKIQPGVIQYDFDVTGFLPTIGKALQAPKTIEVKSLLRLHQQHQEDASRYAREGHILMVRSKGMHIRTMYARVVQELLPAGFKLTGANIVEPHTSNSVESDKGRTFVFYGNSDVELDRIPLEFYTLEPYREGISLADRHLLNEVLVDFKHAERVFSTAPTDPAVQCCVYICKGSQLRDLTGDGWITSTPKRTPFVGSQRPAEQLAQAKVYMEQQCQYELLKAISVGDITSHGVLYTKYFVSPILKHLLLSNFVCNCLRAIYFLQASQQCGSFFSQTDRAMLQDLMLFGVQVFHVDLKEGKLYEYVHRMGTDSGMFVPVDRKEEYLNASYFGVYGSNLVEGDFEADLKATLAGVKELAKTTKHPTLQGKSMAVVTGGGPGVMELGNRVAHNLGILSCGLFVDFGAGAKKPGAVINEQKRNPYVNAWMTYRLEKLVERQSDFNLDFPIFCIGGVGTDFEFHLEEVRRKVGTTPCNPVLLFGPTDHWRQKLTPRWVENVKAGVVKGSEWLSNVCYVVHTGEQALAVYKRFFNGTLAIGAGHPTNMDGFIAVDDEFVRQTA